MKFLIALLFLSSCSLTQSDKSFLASIQGEYETLRPFGDFPSLFTIDSSGDFQYNGITYTFIESFSPSGAYYILDDSQYAGIYLTPRNDILNEVWSTNNNIDGIPIDTHPQLVQMAMKLNQKLIQP